MKSRLCLIILISLLYIACKKSGSSPVPPPSSEKAISSITFKTADNPGLTQDINATINADTASMIIPGNVSLNSLIPSITFTGKSINPASGTAQNFSNPVNYTVTAADGSTKKYIVNARHQDLTDTSTIISGKWNIWKDSLSNINNFYITINGVPNFPISGVYVGTSADYWDFRTNGSLQIFENNNGYSATYQVLSNSKLSIPDLSVYYGNASIQLLDPHNATFFWSAEGANNSHYGRTLFLKK